MALSLKKANNPNSYAQSVNSRFSNVHEMYVDVQTRIDQLLAINPNKDALINRLDAARIRWEINNADSLNDPTKFFDELPESLTVKLSDIFIDVTLQRYVYFQKIVDILVNYEGINVQAIRVYRDKASGKLICWDGQHTLILLYTIIVRSLRLNPTAIDIPIVISSGTLKADARRASLNENGPGKNPFDAFDVYEQEVYGVRIDGSTDPEWLKTEQKQQYLEQNDLFLANERMYNTERPGALTRTEEICSDDFAPEVTKWFATWAKELNGSSRPFGGTEVDIMYSFFNLAMHDSKVNVDLKYVMQVADVCRKVTGTDFNGSMFHNRVKDSYGAFLLRESNKQFNATGTYPSYINQDGTVHKNAVAARKTIRCIGFLCAMLKEAGLKVPAHEKDWTIPKRDLF